MIPAEYIPSTLVSLVALGMAFAFFSADAHSPTSRAMAIAIGAVGVAVGVEVPLMEPDAPAPSWARWVVLFDVLAICAFLEWILRVRKTIPAGDLDTRIGDRALRAGQLAGMVYGVLAIVYPHLREDQFLTALSRPAALVQPGFWLFATPVLFAIVAGAVATGLLLGRRPDRPERIRIIGMVLAIPFLTAGLVLPLNVGTISMVIGEVIFLVGAVHYHVMQGERGQFMSRFMSPQVAQLVRNRGLKHAMQERSLEVTVVCVDIRGFSAYAQAHPSSHVIRVLREYYRVAGQVVADYGATIKDLAGDGILILVGAPLPVADHAARGMEMAGRLRDGCAALMRRWSTPRHPLGIGLGVATGMVTVGAIGAAHRYEYTAVGPAVNLSSRLCEQAADGEILVAVETISACAPCAGSEAIEARVAISVKGFAEPIAHANLRGSASFVTA